MSASGAAATRPAATTRPAERPFDAGGQDVSTGWNGPKVMLVQKRLGIFTDGHDATDDARTVAAVEQWQRDHGREPTGVVDEATWTAMGIEEPWTIDAWAATSSVPKNATREQRIDAMIDFAREQEGSPYLWGGAGPVAIGYDCSGLALQAMRAAGSDPGISSVRHASPGFLSSHVLAEDDRFTHVPRSQLQRGDWVFYADSEGTIRHMSLYLGDSRMIDSYGPGVRERAYREQIGTNRFATEMVLRPFP